MFRSTTIIRELVLSLTKVVLKHSVKYVVICYVVVWQQVEGLVCCVLCRMRLSQRAYIRPLLCRMRLESEGVYTPSVVQNET
jgi:hypothetical protein